MGMTNDETAGENTAEASELERLRSELIAARHDILTMRDHIIGLEAELAVSKHAQGLSARRADALENSRTWQMGQKALTPLRWYLQARPR
jgi:hypothetical protein